MPYDPSVFKTVKTSRPFEEVVTQICDAIDIGDLVVGSKLPSERALARQMDISRPTLREGLSVLVEAGVLEVRPGAGGGTYVASEEIPQNIDSDRWQLQLTEIGELLEARRLIQPRVGQLAGLRATDDDFFAMNAALDLLEEHLSNRRRVLQLDERFQLAMARAAQNQFLYQQIRHILRQLRIARDSTLREGPAESQWALKSLRSILKAIMMRDPDLIEKELYEHLSYLEAIWIEQSGRRRVYKVPEFLLTSHD